MLPLVPKADPLFYARKPQPIGGGWSVTFNIRIDVSPDAQGVRIRALRKAVERGLGWLKGDTRYDKYARHLLDFLRLADTWIWMKINIHTT